MQSGLQSAGTSTGTQNLEVVSIDVERGLLCIRGAVPGSKGGFVLVSDALKRPLPDGVPFPAAIRGGVEAAPEETPGEDAVTEADTSDDSQDDEKKE